MGITILFFVKKGRKKAKKILTLLLYSGKMSHKLNSLKAVTKNEFGEQQRREPMVGVNRRV